MDSYIGDEKKNSEGISCVESGIIGGERGGVFDKISIEETPGTKVEGHYGEVSGLSV